MKQKFSKHWISSVQVRKQRKYRYNAPLHIRHNFLNAHLSKELRTKYGKRSTPIKKGDEVLIMRGPFKKKKGKVSEVNVRRSRITIEGITRTKKDGTKVNVYFDPSKVLIQELNLGDKRRLKSLDRGLKSLRSEEKGTQKKIETSEQDKDKIKKSSENSDKVNSQGKIKNAPEESKST